MIKRNISVAEIAKSLGFEFKNNRKLEVRVTQNIRDELVRQKVVKKNKNGKFDYKIDKEQAKRIVQILQNKDSIKQALLEDSRPKVATDQQLQKLKDKIASLERTVQIKDERIESQQKKIEELQDENNRDLKSMSAQLLEVLKAQQTLQAQINQNQARLLESTNSKKVESNKNEEVVEVKKEKGFWGKLFGK